MLNLCHFGFYRSDSNFLVIKSILYPSLLAAHNHILGCLAAVAVWYVVAHLFNCLFVEIGIENKMVTPWMNEPTNWPLSLTSSQQVACWKEHETQTFKLKLCIKNSQSCRWLQQSNEEEHLCRTKVILFLYAKLHIMNSGVVDFFLLREGSFFNYLLSCNRTLLNRS